MLGSCRILNQEIIVYCPEQTEKLSIIFEASSGLIGRKLKFPFGRPLHLSLRPLDQQQNFQDALAVTEEGFEIRTGSFSGNHVFILDVDYALPSKSFIDALVQRDRAKEFPKDREREFWIHAEMKHPKVLKTKYGRLDLQDVEFGIDVGVSEQIKMVIPPAFKMELETGTRLLQERDPHKKRVLGQAHVKAMRHRGGGTTSEILGHLQELFFPLAFKRYIEVLEDFHYSDCLRGSSFYDKIPFPTYPKSMTVISRADLNLSKLAADGIVKFKEAEFLEKVKDILET